MNNNNEQGNAQKQKQQMAIMKEREDGMSVPNWLLEVLAWITRIEMANSSLSYSCKLFKLLCWPKLHENVKPHRVQNLTFSCGWGANYGHLQLQHRGQPLPIPSVPPPPYILGFNYIDLDFLDDQLLEFVQNILPHLNRINFGMSTVGYQFQVWRWMRGDKKINVFRRLLELLANKIAKFSFQKYARIFEFNEIFPGFIEKFNFICANPNLIPAEFDILFDWLQLPPPTIADKQQKILQFEWQLNEHEINKFFERIKEKFSNANAPLNFFIIRPTDFPIVHFNMENVKTGEILTVTEQMHILRCPKDQESHWNEEGRSKMNERWCDGNEQGRTMITFTLL